MAQKFRFGYTTAPFGLGAPPFEMQKWTDAARRAEDLGFATLLVPDGPMRFSAFQALATVAVVTERLRLSTFVTPVTLRSPGVIAWETASLDHLSGGRFELGIGSGHPANTEGVEQLGAPYPPVGERIRLVGETIAAVSRLAAEAPVQPVQRPRTPIMVGGTGNELLTLAAQQADIIHLGVPTKQILRQKVELIRQAAGDRFDELELSLTLFHIGGGEEPPWLRNYGILPGVEHLAAIRTDDTDVVIDTLQRLRDEFDISYFTIGGSAIEPAIPVIARLAGT